jgi:hypothetical protein
MWAVSISDPVIQGVAGALAAAILAGLVFIGRSAIRSAREKTKAVIELDVSRGLADEGRLRFGLLHVRDGADQARDAGPPVNEVHWFRRKDGDEPRFFVSLRHTKKLGLQFKCFVDYSGMGFEQVADLLRQEEALGKIFDVSEGQPGSNRAWFLLSSSSYPIVNTADGFRNNFLHPA